jgi:hypothetical protein
MNIPAICGNPENTSKNATTLAKCPDSNISVGTDKARTAFIKATDALKTPNPHLFPKTHAETVVVG